MNIIRIETVPQTWNDQTDTAFFTITARLFSTEFVYGAGVLLASFDPSTAADPSSAAHRATVTAVQATLEPAAGRRNR